MTGGLAFEGLNNVCSHPNNLLIILNDNDMSIDANVGGMKDYLVKMTSSSLYNRLRYGIYKQFKRRKRRRRLKWKNIIIALIFVVFLVVMVIGIYNLIRWKQ